MSWQTTAGKNGFVFSEITRCGNIVSLHSPLPTRAVARDATVCTEVYGVDG